MLGSGQSLNLHPNLDISNVEKVIEDVISKYTRESDSENENNQDVLSNLHWNPVDGSSFKNFDFDGTDKGIKANIYDEYISKDPYDFFKLFVSEEIMTHMVKETNLYAEQCLAKEGLKLNSRIKKWTQLTFWKWNGFLRYGYGWACLDCPRYDHIGKNHHYIKIKSANLFREIDLNCC